MNIKVDKPSPELVRSWILKDLKEPIVFHKFITHWDILSWDLNIWAEIFCSTPLPFRTGVNKITETPQWEGMCSINHFTMQQFLHLEERRKNGKKEEPSQWMYFDYKHMNEWFHDNTDVMEGVKWGSLGFPEKDGSDSTLWIGGEGAHTPCHMDTYGCNLVAQVYGSKRWILFPPGASNSLKPTRVPYEESSIYSKRNFFSPDPSMAYELPECRVVTLDPGDVLFVPRHWWHYVENLGTAISINMWLPLPMDDESRLEESLVRFFVSQICKELPKEVQLHYLNPNEEPLVQHQLFDATQVIKSCIRCCSSNEPDDVNCHSKSPKFLGKSDGGSFTHERKKPKYESTSKGEAPTTDILNRSTLNEIVSRYEGFLSAAPKYSTEMFFHYLTDKLNSFARCNAVNSDSLDEKNVECSNVTEDCSSTCTSSQDKFEFVDKITNAFCHPDVIALIKEKIMEQS